MSRTLLVRWLRKVDRWLAALETAGVVGALFGLLVLSLVEITTRNAGIYLPPWWDPFRRQLVLWGGLLGAALAVRSQAHIRFDFLQPRIHGRFAGGVRWTLSLSGVLVCFILARASFRFVQAERGGSAHIAGIPAWVFTTIIPIAFFFMAVHFLLNCGGGAQDDAGASSDPEPS